MTWLKRGLLSCLPAMCNLVFYLKGYDGLCLSTRWSPIYFYIQKIHQHCNNSTPSVLAAFNRNYHHLLSVWLSCSIFMQRYESLTGAMMNLFMHFSLTSPHKQESAPRGATLDLWVLHTCLTASPVGCNLKCSKIWGCSPKPNSCCTQARGWSDTYRI